MRALTTAVVILVAIPSLACSSSSEAGPSAGGTATTVTTRPPAREVSRSELEAFAEGLVADTGAEGGIVAWWVDGAEPLVVTAGVADARTGQRLHTGDAFHVASITKSFVAAAALALEADGTLDLDDALGEYLDWPGGDAIPLRRLLDQTSGVAGFPNGDADDDAYLALLRADAPITIDQTLAAARDLPPHAEPGTTTDYGNLSYVLAGAAIEAATGQGLGTVLDERVFQPLGMDSTWYPPRAPGDAEPLPGLYEVEPGAPVLPTTTFDMEVWRTITAPASGAVSTVDDLVTWVDAALGDQEVDGVDVTAMSDIGPGGYGLGVAGVTEDGACVFEGCPDGASFTRLALNGDIPGSSTRVLRDPATDATLLVYLNRNALELDGPLLEFLRG